MISNARIVKIKVLFLIVIDIFTVKNNKYKK